MTADIETVLSRLRERPECRDAVEVIERLVTERSTFVLAKEGQIGRLEARAQAAEAERDRLREALRLMREWCLDGEEPDGDLIAHVNRLLGESPVPDEPTGDVTKVAASFLVPPRAAPDLARMVDEVRAHPTGEERDR